MGKDRVFVDTNVVLEAFRTGCWAVICEHHAIETVEKCIEEALTGDPSNSAHVHITHDDLTGGLSGRHQVTKKQLANFALKYPGSQALDDGELHLLAWLDSNHLLPTVKVMLSTADKAAIVAAGRINGLDALVSLEHMAQTSGATRAQLSALKRHYRTSWLDEVRFKVRTGIIP